MKIKRFVIIVSFVLLFSNKILAASTEQDYPIIEEFDSSELFASTDPDVYIQDGKVYWTVSRELSAGQQFVYREIPSFYGDVRLTVRGQINSWTNNCFVRAGIGSRLTEPGETPGTANISIDFGFLGGGCGPNNPTTPPGPVVMASGVSLDMYESPACNYYGNWLRIAQGIPYSAQLTISQDTASLSVPDVGTSTGQPTYNGPYNILFVGEAGGGDWPSCSGTIDSMIIEPVTGTTTISDINTMLEENPSSILDQRVTVRAIPARTDDWTFGAGSIMDIAGLYLHTKDLFEVIKAKGGVGSFYIAAKAVLLGQILDNIHSLRSQIILGLDENEGSDKTLYVWDPRPLMNHGVPYTISGTIRRKDYFDIIDLKNDYFYYLEVDDQFEELPAPTHPDYTIPEGYTYLKWSDIDMYGNVGENYCTIGLVTERYQLNGYHYVRIELLEHISNKATVVRVDSEDLAPITSSVALFCGTKEEAENIDPHPGWFPISEYLDTTVGEGYFQLLNGLLDNIEGQERLPFTILGTEIHSPGDIHAYDPQGNHVGAVYDSNGVVVGIEEEIPKSEYIYGLDDAPEALSFGNPTAGVYTIMVRGTDTGTYTQNIQIIDPSGAETYSTTLVSQPTFAGKEDITIIDEIPAAPTGLVLITDKDTITLNWNDNIESDLVGYNIYRSLNKDGQYQVINNALITYSTFRDDSTIKTNTYFYYVTAIDTDNNESGYHSPVANRYYVRLPILRFK